MTDLRLTKSIVESLSYEKSGQVLYRDALLPGFGLRVGKRSKTYFVEGQVDRRTVRTSIGRADVFSAEIARKKAVRLLAKMYDGRNPNNERRNHAAEGISLEQAFEKFFENRRHLKSSSRDCYARTLRVYLTDWSRKPVRDISRQMVLRKHQQLTKERGPYTANSAMRHLRISPGGGISSPGASLPDDPPSSPPQVQF